MLSPNLETLSAMVAATNKAALSNPVLARNLGAFDAVFKKADAADASDAEKAAAGAIARKLGQLANGTGEPKPAPKPTSKPKQAAKLEVPEATDEFYASADIVDSKGNTVTVTTNRVEKHGNGFYKTFGPQTVQHGDARAFGVALAANGATFTVGSRAPRGANQKLIVSMVQRGAGAAEILAKLIARDPAKTRQARINNASWYMGHAANTGIVEPVYNRV